MFYILLVIFIVIVIVAVVAVQLLGKQSNVEEPLPYKFKQNFFSRSEHEFLRILSQQLDTKRFLIFPKVRLADFIEVTLSGNKYQSWWNKIRSKHIDFLIWDIEQSKIVLAIELDGKSHDSEKMQIRDEFVRKLYETVGMRFERVKVGESFEKRAQEISRNL